MAYASYEDVQAGFRDLTADEISVCNALLDEAAVIIDSYNEDASADAKKVVSCRMVRRAIGAGEASVPIGATQGTMTAGPYSQSWTMSGGSTGELYLGRVDKKLLGVSNTIGCSNPFAEVMTS
jgi:hypothetical protein